MLPLRPKNHSRKKNPTCKHFLSLSIIIIGPSRASTQPPTQIITCTHVASPPLKNDNFKACQLGAVTSVTPLCHFCVAKVFYDGTIMPWKEENNSFSQVFWAWCSNGRFWCRERQAHEVGHKVPGAAWNSCGAWAEPSLPFLLPHISRVHSLHFLYISFYELLWKNSRLFPALD